jgi:PDZ domain-containing protein
MLAGMQPRGVTVLAGAIIVGLLSLGVMVAPVPYVVLEPGPTWDTLGEARDGEQVIEIDGAETPDSAGELRLTTVGVQPDISLLDAIRAWFDDEEAVVPEELIYPADQSREDVNQQNQEQFTRSQTTAEEAALRHLGYPTRVVVAGVVDGAPADGLLRAGDVITSVDGVDVDEAGRLQQMVAAQPPGATLSIGYLRGERPDTVEITTEPGGEDGRTPRIGVEIANEMDTPFQLTIELDEIGGPSAGLMFALGIVDKLDPADLTGGITIAGTGTIDGLGNVGPIGGVPQKLVAAREAGATVFLVPSDNCPVAVANPQPGLALVRVGTLQGALAELAALREGRDPTGC